MRIVAEKDAKDALVAMDRWFELYQVIDPMPNPRGTAEDEIKFSMQTYFKPLWVPEEEKWYPYLGGPRLNFIPVCRVISNNRVSCTVHDARCTVHHSCQGRSVGRWAGLGPTRNR
jgi:hypothetical protein